MLQLIQKPATALLIFSAPAEAQSAQVRAMPAPLRVPHKPKMRSCGSTGASAGALCASAGALCASAGAFFCVSYIAVLYSTVQYSIVQYSHLKYKDTRRSGHYAPILLASVED